MIRIHAGAMALGLSLVLHAGAAAANDKDIKLKHLGSWKSGIGLGGAEISAYDAKTRRLFVVNGAAGSLTVLDLSDPAAPAPVTEIAFGGAANSVDTHGGLVAVAVEASPKTDPGKVVFFPAGFSAAQGPATTEVTVGAQPDMLAFTPDGNRVVVANEGEPSEDYAVDPEGSVSIIEVAKFRGGGKHPPKVRTVSFAAFNAGGSRASEVPAGIRAYGPGATLAQDLEPEYIAMADNRIAYVALQEHNALAIVDIRKARVEKIVHLGFKDHSLQENALDPSDRDGGIRIAPWPVKGMYQPDAIAAFKDKGRTYLISANEGDVRDWPAFSEERRVNALALDPTVFPDAAFLKNNANLGRLKVTSTLGDADGDGLHEELYSFGGRSFSVWDEEGLLMFDSGDELEQRTAVLFPANFNAGHENNTLDDRSDDKGPEPEAVTLGKVRGRNYAFVGLERIGGVLVYDISRPQYPRFVDYVNTRDFSGNPAAGTAGDLGPEGVLFISKHDSPTDKPLLVVCHEISGSVSVFAIE